MPKILKMALLTLFLWAGQATAQGVHVYSDGARPSHQNLLASLVETLRRADLLDRVRLHTDGEPPGAGDVANAALVVTVGSEAALTAAKHGVAGQPHLHALIPLSTLHHLQQHHPQGRHGALVLDQPLARRLALLRHALPGRRRLGVLLGPWTRELAAELEKLTQPEWTLTLEHRDEGQKLLGQLRPLLDRSDVLLAVPDPDIYRRDTIHNILLSAYRHRVPVMGFSRNTVRAGALLAVYSTPAQLGRQLAGVVADYLGGGPPPAGVLHPERYRVAVNRQVARSLNLPIPPAEQLHAAMQAAEESAPP